MVPPDGIKGRVKFIEEAGSWNLDRKLLEVESSDGVVKL